MGTWIQEGFNSIKKEPKNLAQLPSFIINALPPGLDTVYEYEYDLQWLSGEEISYFQVETGSFPIYAAFGDGTLDDWLVEFPNQELGEDYLKLFADKDYLNENNSGGSLFFYSDAPPGEGWLVYSGESIRGLAPVPEVPTLLSFFSGIMGLGWNFRRKK